MNTQYVTSRLGLDFKREVSILRQVIYKEIQMWKRSLFEANEAFNTKNGDSVKMYVNGEVYDLAELTELDKQFIDKQLEWFVFGEINEALVKRYAEKVIADLGRGTKMTVAQSGLRDDLQAALKDQLTPGKATDANGEPLPFD